MSDHWNTLADLLGTPSIEPPQKKVAPPKKSERELARASSETPSQPVSESPAAVKTDAVDLGTYTPPAAAPAKAEQPSRLRSSWDTVARLFGVASGSELAPPEVVESSSPPKMQVEPVAKPDDDLFAGFGRKPDRKREEREEEMPRKPVERAASEREPAARPKKKPSSFWGTPEPVADEPIAPRDDFAHPKGVIEPAARFASAEGDEGGMPERRGRSRNIRRGRNSEGVESPRQAIDASEDEIIRERARGEARGEPGPRRGDRIERTADAPRPVRGDRPERTASRSSPDRPVSAERPAARDSERKPRNEERFARGGDRPARGDKGASDAGDEAQLARSGGRTSRQERPKRDDDAQDRPARSRGPIREPRPLEDEGEWDSREVGFEEDIAFDEQDEIIEDREIPREITEEDDPNPAPTRGRRRRRRGGRRRDSESLDSPAGEETSGRQAYGRAGSTEEDSGEESEVENLRIHKVTSWLDAISPMIEANLDNHKRNPGYDRNRGGGSRRRNSSGGSGNR